MAALERALKTHFGFEKFRSQQQEHVVKAVMKGKAFVCKISEVWGVIVGNSGSSPRHQHVPGTSCLGLGIVWVFQVYRIASEDNGL